jgi:DICT domain-containing protein
VLTAIQQAQLFTGQLRDRHHRMAATSPLVAVFGRDMPGELGSGVRGVALDPADPLNAEWALLALGPHFAAALVARDAAALVARDAAEQADRSPRDDHRYDLALTYDRRLVVELCRYLLSRIP